MSKVDFIRELLSDARRSRDSQIVGGLIQCLTTEEVVELLDRSFGHPHNVRVRISRRLTRDRDNETIVARRALIAELTPLLNKLPSARRAACGSLILDLASADGGVAEDEIINIFARSSNGNLRKQALRRIRESPSPFRLQILSAVIRESGDFQVAATLLRIGDSTILKEAFEVLENVVADHGYWLGRLYLLLGGEPPADLERLRQLDPISWLYVCAKLGRPVDDETLLAIFADNLFEERSGLIVWCAGQLRAWNALIAMERLTLDPPQALIEKHYRSIGLRPSEHLTPPTRPVY